MSAPAYLLVKFDDKQKLVAAVDAINGNDKIVNWDAIDGQYNLLLKLESDDSKIFDFIKSLDGFEAMSSCTIEKIIIPSMTSTMPLPIVIFLLKLITAAKMPSIKRFPIMLP